MFRPMRKSVLSALLAASLTAVGGLVAAAPAAAGDTAYWPEDEDDQHLKELDNEVLKLQEARFRAIFAEKKDEKEIERLQKEFKKAQEARRNLLRKTGRY